MRRATQKFEERRSERRFAADGGQHRTLIAQAAARLIALHGITDWTMAKRKAARELALPGNAALPGDDEIEDALATHHALFGGAAHAALIRAERLRALGWMRNLAAFAPRLTGGVAAGWATATSGITLELEADNAKAVELALINAGVHYRPLSANAAGPIELAVDSADGGPLHLVVRTREVARTRPRRDRNGREELRLTAREVEELLAAD
jgi:hypothetical protein